VDLYTRATFFILTLTSWSIKRFKHLFNWGHSNVKVTKRSWLFLRKV